MNVPSSLQKDIRCQKATPGAYEWWYFDAISADGKTALVVIFYEGNPFSRRYINNLKRGGQGLAANFPAVSISIYQNEQPVYYSFTEAKKKDAFFKNTHPFVQIENHKMEAKQDADILEYQLILNETLASGDTIKADLHFQSPVPKHEDKANLSRSVGQHHWQVFQPRASVEGLIQCSLTNGEPQNINFKGLGYHDHNVGLEPLKEEFEQWYWGCFHFTDATLIYYLMKDCNNQNSGWLIPEDRSASIKLLDEVEKEDVARNMFGLRSARKISLRGDQVKVVIQQRALLDNGPFYQRFSSDAFLRNSETDSLSKSSGLTEYLCPPRIHQRLFWPLTNMRIRYKQEQPHWVQRSPRFYRWTW